MTKQKKTRAGAVEVAHTPGPWKAGSDHSERVHIESPDGRWICGIYDGPGTNAPDADARLIAAAPEMLAVLEEKVRITRCANCGKCWDCRARAAIARAKGEKE